MNESASDRPALPPPLHPTPASAGVGPLEPDFSGVLGALLKNPARLLLALGAPGAGGAILIRLALAIAACGAVYGLVMGSLSGGAQLWAAPAKLTVGLFASILLCLPSLHIFLCLNGAEVRATQVTGALLGMVALITLLLVGFAPVAWIFSQSTDSLAVMGMLHLLFWIIGLWFGVRLIKGLAACANADAPALGHLKVWIVIFVLVSLQMSSALRPLIGTAPTLLPTEKRFFLQHWVETMGR
jgi:hypothetical protein